MNAIETDDTRIMRAILGAVREHDLTAFEIWQWLGPVHGASGALSESRIYPTLYGLEEKRLIEGSWQEGEGTRRRYRITARGLKLATREGWAPVAHRRGRAGVAATGAGPTRGDAEEEGEGWFWPTEMPALADRLTGQAGSPEALATEAYLDLLQKALRLSPIFSSDVCHEIADHIADHTARLVGLGETTEDASAQVLAALGPPDVLAERINDAQLTSGRLRGGLSWGSAAATLTGLVGFAVAFDAIEVGGPWFVGLLVPIAGLFGIHLYAPIDARWDSQAQALSLAIGAFVGARRSMPFLADRSRQSDGDAWRTWALAGAIPLALITVLLPVALDPLAAVIMLAPLVAWILGTRRAATLTEDTVTARGLVICILLATCLTFLPGGRLWYYDPSTHPATDPAARATNAVTTWQGPVNGQQVTVVGLPSGWHDASVQIWPAARIGPVIVPDPGATTASVVIPSGGVVDFSTLPGNQIEWWISVTAIGPDGRTYVVANALRFGYPYETHSAIIAWLVNRI